MDTVLNNISPDLIEKISKNDLTNKYDLISFPAMKNYDKFFKIDKISRVLEHSFVFIGGCTERKQQITISPFSTINENSKEEISNYKFNIKDTKDLKNFIKENPEIINPKQSYTSKSLVRVKGNLSTNRKSPTILDFNKSKRNKIEEINLIKNKILLENKMILSNLLVKLASSASSKKNNTSCNKFFIKFMNVTVTDRKKKIFELQVNNESMCQNNSDLNISKLSINDVKKKSNENCVKSKYVGKHVIYY